MLRAKEKKEEREARERKKADREKKAARKRKRKAKEGTLEVKKKQEKGNRKAEKQRKKEENGKENEDKRAEKRARSGKALNSVAVYKISSTGGSSTSKVYPTRRAQNENDRPKLPCTSGDACADDITGEIVRDWIQYWFYENVVQREEKYVVMVDINTIKSLWTVDFKCIWSSNVTMVALFSATPLEKKMKWLTILIVSASFFLFCF